MKMVDGKLVSDDTKETVSKFNIPPEKPNDSNADKTLIGNGKSLEDLVKEAKLKDELTSANKSSDPIESFRGGNSGGGKSDKLDKVINILSHAESIIKLIAPHFTTHVDRIKAEKKIRNYFDTKE